MYAYYLTKSIFVIKLFTKLCLLHINVLRKCCVRPNIREVLECAKEVKTPTGSGACVLHTIGMKY